MPDAPDFSPLTDDAWPDDVSDMLDGFAGGLNVYRTMAHHPALLRAWAPLREHIINHNTLGRAMSEVVILRTGARLGSDYEWKQHIVRARQYGLKDKRIRTLRGPVEDMDQEDALLAGAVDELLDTKALSPEIAVSLVSRYGCEAVLDLMATVGFYSTLGYLLNSFSTPLDEDVAASLFKEPFN